MSASNGTDPRHADARRLRAEGWLLREIAEHFGIAIVTARAWVVPGEAERLRAAQRERRKRYQGCCEECGAPTDGSGGRAAAPKRCLRCYAGSVRWDSDAVVHAIRRLADRLGRAPTAAEINAAGRADYPRVGTVQKVFGSWAAALAAAGLEPRGQGKRLTSAERAATGGRD